MHTSGLKKVYVVFGFAVTLACWGCVGHVTPVVEKPDVALHNAFPNLPFESVEPTDIKGLFEVVSGTNIIYYYPEKDYLFVGEIYAPPGISITANKKSGLAAKAVKNLPLDKAVKIGNGKTVIIEFTDPDCPFCRKSYDFLKNRSDITHYVFLTPLAHPAAITKVYYILNAEDKVKAYNEMFEGRNAVQPASGYSEQVKKLAQEHINLARMIGVTGTPTSFINGKQIVGADIPQIEKLLNDAAKIEKLN
jgi:thiol:disulfide interchange protein DsbC